MEAERAKWFLQTFAEGKKIDKAAVQELYLSGYLGIELPTFGREPVPTAITEKGKLVLEGRTAERSVPVRRLAVRSAR